MTNIAMPCNLACCCVAARIFNKEVTITCEIKSHTNDPKRGGNNESNLQADSLNWQMDAKIFNHALLKSTDKVCWLNFDYIC